MTKYKFCRYYHESHQKWRLNFSHGVLFHIETKVRLTYSLPAHLTRKFSIKSISSMIWDDFKKYKENSSVNIAVFEKISC